MPEENDIEQEIKQIVKEEVPKHVPDVVFPDVQKVEITNPPKAVRTL